MAFLNLFKFNKTGSIDNLNGKTRNISQKRKVAKMVKMVVGSMIREKSLMSIKMISQAADTSYRSEWLVSRKDLILKPYKYPFYE